MPELPEKRQSVSPDRRVLLAVLGVAVVLAAVWFSVSAAVSGGGEDCPARGPNSTIERCR
jgi:hypothetical protein